MNNGWNLVQILHTEVFWAVKSISGIWFILYLAGCGFTGEILRSVPYFILWSRERLSVVSNFDRCMRKNRCSSMNFREWIQSRIHYGAFDIYACIHTYTTHIRWVLINIYIFLLFFFAIVMGWCCSQSHIACSICPFPPIYSAFWRRRNVYSAHIHISNSFQRSVFM